MVSQSRCPERLYGHLSVLCPGEGRRGGPFLTPQTQRRWHCNHEVARVHARPITWHPGAASEDSGVGKQAQPLPLCWDPALCSLFPPTQRYHRASWTQHCQIHDPKHGTPPWDRCYPELREITSTTSTALCPPKQRELQWEPSSHPVSSVHLPKHIPWLCRF